MDDEALIYGLAGILIGFVLGALAMAAGLMPQRSEPTEQPEDEITDE